MKFHLKADLGLIHKNKLNLYLFSFFFLEKEVKTLGHIPCHHLLQLKLLSQHQFSGGDTFQKARLKVISIEYIELVKSVITTSITLLYTLWFFLYNLNFLYQWICLKVDFILDESCCFFTCPVEMLHCIHFFNRTEVMFLTSHYLKIMLALIWLI